MERITWTRESCSTGKTCPRAGRTDRGTKLVQGYPITDPARLTELGVPEGEMIVEVPASLLPEV